MTVKPADIFLNQVDARRRNVQRGIVRKTQRQILFAAPLLGDRVHSGELGDAMRNMDDVVADFQVEERIDRPRGDDFPDLAALLVAMEELVVAQKRDRTHRLLLKYKSAMQITHWQIDFLPQPRRILIEQLGKALFFARILAKNRHIVRLRQFLQLLE